MSQGQMPEEVVQLSKAIAKAMDEYYKSCDTKGSADQIYAHAADVLCSHTYAAIAAIITDIVENGDPEGARELYETSGAQFRSGLDMVFKKQGIIL